jgi:hypothetical protein
MSLRGANRFALRDEAISRQMSKLVQEEFSVFWEIASPVARNDMKGK